MHDAISKKKQRWRCLMIGLEGYQEVAKSLIFGNEPQRLAIRNSGDAVFCSGALVLISLGSLFFKKASSVDAPSPPWLVPAMEPCAV